MCVLRRLVNRLLVYFFLCFSYLSISQDIEPRRWNALPLQTNVVALGYGHTTGDILFDPLLQAEDVTVKINTLVASYIRPFKIGNKLARLDVVIPYNNGNWEGLLSEVPTRIHRDGFSDREFDCH